MHHGTVTRPSLQVPVRTCVEGFLASAHRRPHRRVDRDPDPRDRARAPFDRLGRYEPAATIAGFALSPLSAAAVPKIATAITHLREVLDEATYESLARKGEAMTIAAIATSA